MLNKRTSREEWLERVRGWVESGVSSAEYAARIGVNPRSLSWWKWKLGVEGERLPLPRRSAAAKGREVERAGKKRGEKAPRQPAAPPFVEVSGLLSTVAAPQADGMELIVGVARIRLSRHFDEAALCRVLDVLEARS